MVVCLGPFQTRSSKKLASRDRAYRAWGVQSLLGEGGMTYKLNLEGGTRSSKKLASSVRQGLQGMGCSKLLAEGG